ncbi:MAG: hypothetical protein LBD29_07870, partial [Treponema sp.]|nr:hypothetical protein [Treponema sp.]
VGRKRALPAGDNPGRKRPRYTAGVQTVSVCGREGDMYELFDAAEQAGQLFLIRIALKRFGPPGLLRSIPCLPAAIGCRNLWVKF